MKVFLLIIISIILNLIYLPIIIFLSFFSYKIEKTSLLFYPLFSIEKKLINMIENKRKKLKNRL